MLVAAHRRVQMAVDHDAAGKQRRLNLEDAALGEEFPRLRQQPGPEPERLGRDAPELSTVLTCGLAQYNRPFGYRP